MKTSETSSGTIILGPHRCGTSLVTSLIAGMGHDLGGEIIPAEKANPEGYWEHRGVVENHNNFLRAVGRSWSDPLPLDPSVFSGTEATAARGHIKEIFDRDFRGKRLWVLKDPRLCRLLPLWDEVLNSKDVAIRFVHVVRSPIAAAASLEKRDGMRLETSFVLWLRHLIEAELATRRYDRLWVALENIASDPIAQVSRLAAWLNENSNKPGQDIETLVASVFRPDLLHNKATPDEPVLNDFPWVTDLYRELSSWTATEDPSQRKILDRILAEISTADRLMIGNPLAAHQSFQREERLVFRGTIEDFQRSTHTMRVEISTHRQETEQLRSQVGDLQHLVTRIETKHAELLSRSLDLTSEIEKKYIRQTEEFHEVQKNVQRLETDLATLHTARDLLEEKIRDKDQEITQAGHKITDLEAILGQVTSDNAAFEVEKANLAGLVNHLEQELDRSQKAWQLTSNTLNVMTRQLSWRITAPLRAIRGFLPSREK